MKLTLDMKMVIATQKLCFAATVTKDGKPNLSPKGTIRVWDDNHLFFCDIVSPQTRQNLTTNPWIELNVVDILSRRGYRFLGKARIHIGDEIYDLAKKRIIEEEGAEYPVESIIIIKVGKAFPVISPGYLHVSDEWEMRSIYRKKRLDLDKSFDKHIEIQGPLKGSKKVKS